MQKAPAELGFPEGKFDRSLSLSSWESAYPQQPYLVGAPPASDPQPRESGVWLQLASDWNAYGPQLPDMYNRAHGQGYSAGLQGPGEGSPAYLRGEELVTTSPSPYRPGQTRGGGGNLSRKTTAPQGAGAYDPLLSSRGSMNTLTAAGIPSANAAFPAGVAGVGGGAMPMQHAATSDSLYREHQSARVSATGSSMRSVGSAYFPNRVYDRSKNHVASGGVRGETSPAMMGGGGGGVPTAATAVLANGIPISIPNTFPSMAAGAGKSYASVIRSPTMRSVMLVAVMLLVLRLLFVFLGGNFLGSMSSSGVSVVLACNEHSEKLGVVLGPVLELNGLGEVIVVDSSSSEEMLQMVHGVNKRIKYVGVQGVTSDRYTISRAFNLGVSLAAGSHVLLMDCDIAVSPDFVMHQQELTRAAASLVSDKSQSSFTASSPIHAGWWLHALPNTVNAVEFGVRLDTSAIMYISQDLFWSVGGYDERIFLRAESQRDFELRLEAFTAQESSRMSQAHPLMSSPAAPMVIHDISPESAFRIALPDESLPSDEQSAAFFMDIERKCTDRIEHESRRRWQTVAADLRATYTIAKRGKFVYEAQFHRPRGEQSGGELSKSLVLGGGTKTVTAAGKSVVGPANLTSKAELINRLHDGFSIPLVLLNAIDPLEMIVLRDHLEEIAEERTETHARVLVAHVMHGMGNRARALGSAMSFARRTNRFLLVIWPTDSHLQAPFQSLFQYEPAMQKMIVIPDFAGSKWSELSETMKGGPGADKAWGAFQIYNYMDTEGYGAVKDAFIDNSLTRHIYFKSAYIMQTKGQYSSWDSENQMLRLLRPVPEVQTIVEEVNRQIMGGLKNCVGVHIRHLSLDSDIKGVQKDEYSQSAQETMDYWRSKARPQIFEKEMKAILAESPSTCFFLAADGADTVTYLKNALPDRVITLPRPNRSCEFRDAECVKYALADVLCLARTRALLGSNWSSFTEMALRLGHKNARLAGVDFGTD
ncbi:hypothetical protein FVE85_6573 [Porphyridium purpureum]|uniref:Glycosyltransferase 2-like domain-containing protein n=1 Tax=Porphyridium purpureum TaxID=35688 RepID=A0A5J4Z6Z7_PORPP|nr:hypothetical protein FVE85_6573 [Porphyridium purpureum]|eukprot:POR0528..scf295_1